MSASTDPLRHALIDGARRLGLTHWAETLLNAHEPYDQLRTLGTLSHQAGPEQLHLLGLAATDSAGLAPLRELGAMANRASHERAVAVCQALALLFPTAVFATNSSTSELRCELSSELPSSLLVHLAHVLSGLVAGALPPGCAAAGSWSVNHHPERDVACLTARFDGSEPQVKRDGPHHLARHPSIALAAIQWSRALVHAVQNTLMVVDGQTQLIRNDPASGSTAAKRLDDIETSTRRLKCKAERLRSGLLLLSESDESWTPVSEAIVTAQRQLAPMTGSLQVDVHGEETLELLCPSDVLVSIFRELLANASDARRPGDNVAYAKVQIERGPVGPIIVVTDSGQLSLPEVLNRATLPFIAYPSLPSKAGFGLALVKTLVEAVSGSLTLTETAQGGCKVTICWPEERTRRSQALDLDG